MPTGREGGGDPLHPQHAQLHRRDPGAVPALLAARPAVRRRTAVSGTRHGHGHRRQEGSQPLVSSDCRIVLWAEIYRLSNISNMGTGFSNPHFQVIKFIGFDMMVFFSSVCFCVFLYIFRIHRIIKIY